MYWILLYWRFIFWRLERKQIADIFLILFLETSIVCRLNPSCKKNYYSKHISSINQSNWGREISNWDYSGGFLFWENEKPDFLSCKSSCLSLCRLALLLYQPPPSAENSFLVPLSGYHGGLSFPNSEIKINFYNLENE